MMAYAASVGSARAKRKVGAMGFIGNATDATAHFFGREQGLGTMPHALIGYAGSTVRAAEMFHETFPDEPMTVLVDYFGREITDSLAVCRRFPDLAAKGRLSFRLDTPGGRYRRRARSRRRSYAVLERHSPESIRGYRSEEELRYLVGTGVSAAAILHLRDELDTRRLRQGARSSPPRASVRPNAGSWPRPRRRSTWSAPGSFLPSQLDRDLRHRRHRRI